MRPIILIVLSFCLMACNAPTTQKPMEKVRVSMSRDGITWLPISLAQSLQLFKQQHLDVSFFDSAGMSKSMEALVGGSVEIVGSGMGQVIQAAAEGRQVRAFVLFYRRPTMALAVAPSVPLAARTVAALKGKPVGVPTPGSPAHQFLNFVLSKNGMRPQDVTIVSIGTASPSLAALERGKVAAAILVGSAIPSYAQRNPEVAFLSDTRTEEATRRIFGTDSYPSTCLAARVEWLQSHHDTASRFAKAVSDAMQWMRTHTPEEVRARIPEALRMPDAQVDLQAIRQALSTLSPDGLIPPGGPEFVRSIVGLSDPKVRSANIDLASIYTNEFVTAK